MKEYNYFKSSDANHKFSFWLAQFPESFHPLDVERFNEMVLSVLDNNEHLEYSHITQSETKLEEWQIDNYMERYFAMKAMYDLLKKQI